MLEENEVGETKKGNAGGGAATGDTRPVGSMETEFTGAGGPTGSGRRFRVAALELMNLKEMGGSLGCGDRGKKPTTKEEQGVTRPVFRIQDRDMTPSYQLERCQQVTAEDNKKKQDRAYLEGLIVQDILDQWKLKERTVRNRLQLRHEIKKTKRPTLQPEEREPADSIGSEHGPPSLEISQPEMQFHEPV